MSENTIKLDKAIDFICINGMIDKLSAQKGTIKKSIKSMKDNIDYLNDYIDIVAESEEDMDSNHIDIRKARLAYRETIVCQHLITIQKDKSKLVKEEIKELKKQLK